MICAELPARKRLRFWLINLKLFLCKSGLRFYFDVVKMCFIKKPSQNLLFQGCSNKGGFFMKHFKLLSVFMALLIAFSVISTASVYADEADVVNTADLKIIVAINRF